MVSDRVFNSEASNLGGGRFRPREADVARSKVAACLSKKMENEKLNKKIIIYNLYYMYVHVCTYMYVHVQCMHTNWYM